MHTHAFVCSTRSPWIATRLRCQIGVEGRWWNRLTSLLARFAAATRGLTSSGAFRFDVGCMAGPGSCSVVLAAALGVRCASQGRVPLGEVGRSRSLKYIPTMTINKRGRFFFSSFFFFSFFSRNEEIAFRAGRENGIRGQKRGWAAKRRGGSARWTLDSGNVMSPLISCVHAYEAVILGHRLMSTGVSPSPSFLAAFDGTALFYYDAGEGYRS